jgi:hypothetical protein
MITKLTLSIGKRIIHRAKNYAHRNGKSLSKVVQQYLELLTENTSEKMNDLKLKKLYGAVKLPVNLNHKKEIRRILSAKGQ